MTGHTSGQVQDDLTRLGDMEPTCKVNKLKLWKGEWWVLSSKYQVLLPDIMFWSLHKLESLRKPSSMPVSACANISSPLTPPS